MGKLRLAFFGFRHGHIMGLYSAARKHPRVEDVSFVDLFGTYSVGQADVVKSWTGSPCEIKSVNISDTSGESISPTLGVLFFKGSADGACDNMKIKPVWGTSFYKKEGDTWKLVFGFESPA